MKILIISPYFYPHKGGSQQYMEELYATLMRQNPFVEVDIICYNTDGAPKKEEYRGMTIYRIGCIELLRGQFAIPNYIELWRLLKRLKKNKYDFINANTRFFDSAWWTPIVARYFKTKSILTDHCATSPTHSLIFVSWVASLVDKFLVPFISRFYDLFTVTNKATYEYMRKLGVERPVIVYGGVDSNYFNLQKNNGKTHKDSLDPITITFVGRMIPSKGPQILLEAAKEIVQKMPYVKFVFAGGGELYEKFSKEENKNIFFIGSQNKKGVATLLSSTDILVHPSLHHEGFPNVLLEAGAAGCAVIATNQGGTKEIIINGKTGLLVEPEKNAIKEVLLELIDDNKKRDTLAIALRKHVQKHFDWLPIAKDYQKLIKTIAS